MTTSSFCRNGLRRTTRRGASLGDRLHSGALSGGGDAFRHQSRYLAAMLLATSGKPDRRTSMTVSSAACALRTEWAGP